MKGTCKMSETPSKDQIYESEEGEDIQTKGIDNLFNNVIAENFPNIEKERNIQVQEAYRTPNHQDQNRNTSRYNQSTKYREQKRALKTAKEKRQVTNKDKKNNRFLNTNFKCKKVMKRCVSDPERSNYHCRLVYPAHYPS
jgi:hypothetical protein